MTADEARALATDRERVSESLVEAVLKLWHRSIRCAAERGETVVNSHAVGRLRTPVNAATTAAVLDRLRADGFAVTTKPGSGFVVVSWTAAPAEPA